MTTLHTGSQHTSTQTPTSRGERATSALLVSATVATGLMAGFFYAYSCSVMIGLAQADDATFITAMQVINANIRNMWFGPAFFGTALLTTLAAVIVVARRRPGRWFVVTGAVLYIATFVITMALAVPLNDELAAAGPVAAMADPAAVRLAYEDPWTRWNLLRTLLNSGSLVAMCLALVTPRRA